jgi:hypothetical protein
MILKAPNLTRKTRQRLLQVGMGIVLLFLAFLLEMAVIEPGGIYSYSWYGYKGFRIGLSREGLLKEVNKVGAIRRIMTCQSNSTDQSIIDLKLASRRFFDMTEDLTRSDVWICQGKKKVAFLFLFQEDHLSRVLRLKGLSFKEGTFPLLDRCRPGIYRDMDGYLNRLENTRVFYGDAPRQSE